MNYPYELSKTVTLNGEDSILIDPGATLTIDFELQEPSTIEFSARIPAWGLATPEGSASAYGVVWLMITVDDANPYSQTSSDKIQAPTWWQTPVFNLSVGRHSLQLRTVTPNNLPWPSGTGPFYISGMRIGGSVINLERWFNNQSGTVEDWAEQAQAIYATRAADAPTNYALKVDGTAQYVSTVPFNPGLDDFTVEAWVSTLAPGPLLSSLPLLPAQPERERPDAQIGMILALNQNGVIVFGLNDRMNTFRLTSGPTQVFDGDWHHIAAVRQGNTATIYFDGVPAPASSLPPVVPSGPIAFSNQENFWMGYALYEPKPIVPPHWIVLDSGTLNGLLDEVRVWQRALPADEIANSLHHQLTDKEPGLFGHWTFDAQDGTDSSPNGNTGELIGNPTFVPSELDFALPGAPYLVTQAKLMQDYVPDQTQSGKLVEVSGYRTIVTAKDANGYPRQSWLTLWASEPATIHFPDGTQASIDMQQSYKGKTNGLGELSFVIDANNRLTCPLIKVHADFMNDAERLIISPDRHAHDTLANVTGNQLTGRDVNGQPLPANKNRAPLPAGSLAGDVEAAAQAIRHVMSTAVNHDLQTDRPLTRARSSPEDTTLPRPYVPRYQNVRLLTNAYDAHSDAIATHFLPTDQDVARILVAENMLNPHWVYDHSSQSFSALTPEQRDTQLSGLTVKHLDDYTNLFMNRRSLSLTADQLLGTAVRELGNDGISTISRKWFGEGFLNKVEDAGSIVVTTVETTVEGAVDTVKTIVVTAVSKVKDEVTGLVQAFDAALQTVEDAVNFVGAVLKKFGAEVSALVDFIKSLFEWGDILITQRALEAALINIHTVATVAIQSVKSSVDTAFDRLTAGITTEFDSLISAVQGQSLKKLTDRDATAAPQDIKSKYLHSMYSSNVGNGDPSANPTFNPALAQQMDGSLSGAISQNQLATSQSNYQASSLSTFLTSPDKLMRAGVAELLTALKTILTDAIQLLRAGVDAILGMLESMLNELHRLSTTRIVIPFVTEFYEQVIMEGDGSQLTFYSLVALAAAVPYTIAYKLISGKDEPVFTEGEVAQIADVNWEQYQHLSATAQQELSIAAEAPVSSKAMIATRGSVDALQKVAWGLNYAYAGFTLLWGIASVIEDIPAKVPEDGETTPLTGGNATTPLSFVTVCKLMAQSGAWVTSVPWLSTYGDTGAKLGLEFGIWASELLPFGSNIVASRSSAWNKFVDPFLTGMYGLGELLMYCFLMAASTAAGDDKDAVVANLLINIADSFEWTPQLAKLDPEFAWIVPITDAIAYGAVGAGTIALTTVDMVKALR